MSKRAMILAFVAVDVVVIAAVLVYGYRAGWFSPKKPPAEVVKPPVPPKKVAPPEDVVSTQGVARLDAIRKASNQDFAKAVSDWAKAPGVERKISWEAVRLGAKAGEDRQVRLRACELAAALAGGKPEGLPMPPAADERAVEPLIGCLKSGDVGLVQASTAALGAINLQNPAFKVEAKAIPEVKKLLAGDDAPLAAAALPAVAFFQEISMAPDILAAWEKHGKAPGFADAAAGKLKILMELKLRQDLKKEHPDWSREQCLGEAKKKVPELAGQHGNDPGKWKAWWAQALPAVTAPKTGT